MHTENNGDNNVNNTERCSNIKVYARFRPFNK